MPRVSICCGVLNQSEWLKEMIQSVVSQTFPDWELLIVDDGSTEDIKAVVDSFNDPRIILHRFDENQNVPNGTNWGYRHASGEFIQPLAADERMWERKLEWQVAYLDSNPGIDCVCGLPESGPLGERPEWEMYALRAHNRSREHWIKTLLAVDRVPIGGCSILARKRVLGSIGLMDTNLTIFCDHEWYLRLIEKHEFRMVPVRFAVSLPNPDAISAWKPEKEPIIREQLEYVRSKHPLVIPPTTGKVTVGIPVYNMGWCVKDAIEAVRAQTWVDWELLILNDASTDDTMEVLKTYVSELNDPRIKLLEFDENRGNMAALTQMAFRAEGVFFMPLSADDVVDPRFMEKCIAEFAKNPWLEFVSTQTDFIDKDGKPWTDMTHPFCGIPKPVNMEREQWLHVLSYANVYFGQGMYRTKAVSEVGGWSPQHGVLGDYEMYLKLLQRENIYVIDEKLTHTRIHGDNISLKCDPQKLRQQYHDAKKPYYKPKQKIIIATPFYEIKGFSPYISSIVNTAKMLTASGVEWEFMELSGDSYVHRARNTICARFLEDPDATDLFFIDSDMSWDPMALMSMITLPYDVIGGTYPVKGKWDAWTSIPAKFRDDKGNIVHMGPRLSDGSHLMHADVLAGGFLRIKRHVLERYREFFPKARYREPCADYINANREYTEFFASGKEDGIFYGEDHWFSKRMREMGTEMYIYPNTTIVHWGNKGWDGNFMSFMRKAAEEQAAAK